MNYEYEWETVTLSCSEGKRQLKEIGRNSIALGNAYKKLELDSATRKDISITISQIDQITADNQLEMSKQMWNQITLDEDDKVNALNKSLLKAALESK